MAFGGEGGTKQMPSPTPSSNGMLLFVGVVDRSQVPPISDMGTEALINSSQTNKFSLNVCGVGGTTSTFTEINRGCTSFVSMTIKVISSFFSKHNEVISDFWVNVDWRCEFMDVTEALLRNAG